MSYTVLARKYRPQNFSDLVGQEHVARTLGNALESDRVAHAFLFTGVRGIGKTTTARLLAKALNCEKGPAREPCNQCDPCKEITAGTDMDVLEIDGASNNGVDDVRRLQETLPYRPARDRFKVVIVDEVHMLSAGAFNAFLKTLEEPPPHVKFIFATTENHKIPLTIRSRCQRYDFRLISRAEIAKRIREILKAEAIDADEAAVELVTRQANGSMRDALTLLDQVAALGGQKVCGDEVASWLGIADRGAVVEVAKALLAGDATQCLRSVSQIAEQGLDILHFSRELLELLRDIVVVRVTGADSNLVELGPDERLPLSAIANTYSAQHVERAFAGVARLVDDVARSATPRIALEMGLVRLADRPALEPIGDLLAKLAALETRVAGGSRGGPQGPAAPTPDRPSEAKAPSAGRKAYSAQSAAHAATAAPARKTAAVGASNKADSEVKAQCSERPSLPECWDKIVSLLRDSQPALGAILEHGVPVEVSETKLQIAFREGSFFGRQAAEASAQEAIGAAAARVFGQRPQLQIISAPEPEKMGISVSESENAREQERLKGLHERALSHPRVKEAIEVFPEAKDHISVRTETTGR
jgi:DNA polymerase-3 subunit gamma/tau